VSFAASGFVFEFSLTDGAPTLGVGIEGMFASAFGVANASDPPTRTASLPDMELRNSLFLSDTFPSRMNSRLMQKV
jgi:hypothetical protein